MASEQRILAIETSGRHGSAAIGTASGVCAATELTGSMRHAAELMPSIDALLRSQNWAPDSLTDVFVSIGPGSFTGLRIAVTIARTLAWSIGARIVAVPTVDVLAWNALLARPRPEHVAVVLDAKRAQVYAGSFRLDGESCVKITDACLADPAEFLATCPRPLAVLGEGVGYHRTPVDASGATVLAPELWPGRAEHVFALGLELAGREQYTAPGDLLPLYIRRPEAEEKWEKLHPSAPPLA
jgi:tRNA threonylcarbamoyladenosine biosynthesis protein TsaB